MIEHLFTGNALCAVAPRGQLTLPPFVRSTLSLKVGARRIFIGLHETDTCLVGIDREELTELSSDCRRRRIAEEALIASHNSMRLRRIFGSMDEVWVRASGRVDIPPALRSRAQIGDAALVIGTGASFELWSPHVALEAGDPETRELAAFHLEIQKAA